MFSFTRAQAGDEAAFAELMRAHYAYVYGVVIKIVNNPHDAEEVVQETFFSAYRGLPQLEDRRKFKSWLAEIARNRARDRLRKQKVDTVSIDEVSAHTLQTPDAVDDELIRDEQRELIRRAMETLSEKDREIARAYYLDGASYDELIQTHGLSYKAISVRLSRAKQRLIKRLGHLLTAIFLPPATIFKQIYSGGLIAMKIGTAPKITVGAIGIIALLFIGVHQMILPKFFAPKDNASSVQTKVPSEELVETEANQKTEDGKTQRQISDQDMAQIKNFFAQFDSDEMPALLDSVADERSPHLDSEAESAVGASDADDEHNEVAESRDASETNTNLEEAEAVLTQIHEAASRFRQILVRKRDLALGLKHLYPEAIHNPKSITHEYFEVTAAFRPLFGAYMRATGPDFDAFDPGGAIYEALSGLADMSADPENRKISIRFYTKLPE